MSLNIEQRRQYLIANGVAAQGLSGMEILSRYKQMKDKEAGR